MRCAKLWILLNFASTHVETANVEWTLFDTIILVYLNLVSSSFPMLTNLKYILLLFYVPDLLFFPSWIIKLLLVIQEVIGLGQTAVFQISVWLQEKPIEPHNWPSKYKLHIITTNPCWMRWPVKGNTDYVLRYIRNNFLTAISCEYYCWAQINNDYWLRISRILVAI